MRCTVGFADVLDGMCVDARSRAMHFSLYRNKNRGARAVRPGCRWSAADAPARVGRGVGAASGNRGGQPCHRYAGPSLARRVGKSIQQGMILVAETVDEAEDVCFRCLSPLWMPLFAPSRSSRPSTWTGARRSPYSVVRSPLILPAWSGRMPVHRCFARTWQSTGISNERVVRDDLFHVSGSSRIAPRQRCLPPGWVGGTVFALRSRERDTVVMRRKQRTTHCCTSLQ